MNIIVAGDFCPLFRVADCLEQDEFAHVFDNVKEVLKFSDYSIVNLECPITKGVEKPIEKCGPNLQCSRKGIEAVKWAGFNCVTLANNHFLDYGEEGTFNTIMECQEIGLDTVGGGMNLKEASNILYKEINGKILAVINCCEHEFSIATEASAGSNPLNPIQQYYAIKEARTKADYVLVIVHGGNEHYQLPNPQMQDTYRFFVDAGADAVVNHHQHCYSGYEVYEGRPIFYGLGNFCFDWEGKRNSMWNEGYLIRLSFGDELKFEIIPYRQCNDTPKIEVLEKKIFDESIEKLNSIILNKQQLLSSYDAFIESSSNFSAEFSPYSNRVLNALCRRHLLPSFMNRNKRRLILAYIQCESHLPKVIKYLKK
jgi:poly-gamma-glutamate synthesis protein (capsule biosynthesis protein)